MKPADPGLNHNISWGYIIGFAVVVIIIELSGEDESICHLTASRVKGMICCDDEVRLLSTDMFDKKRSPSICIRIRRIS